MATMQDVLRFALSLPETIGDGESVSVRCGSKYRGFAWVWKERIEPKKPRVPNFEVLAIRTADLEEKELLLQIDRERFFTEPHYNNFPAILVRLPNIEIEELEALLLEGWRCMAPKSLVKTFDGTLQ